jgi:hypothetical protein
MTTYMRILLREWSSFVWWINSTIHGGGGGGGGGVIDRDRACCSSPGRGPSAERATRACRATPGDREEHDEQLRDNCMTTV